VYERALLREFGLRSIRVAAQASFVISYKGQAIGEYYCDILVEDVLVVELKCVERLSHEHMAQCLNYLRVSGRCVCLLVNFQRPKAEWRRIVNGYQPAEAAETVPAPVRIGTGQPSSD
jgi:GxxExxY protein